MSKKILKKVICLLSALLVLASVIAIPISAVEDGKIEYTEETANHLRYDKFCELFEPGSVVNTLTGCYYFIGVKNVIIDDENLGDDTADFDCGRLIDFIPTIKADVEYTFYLDNGKFYLGDRELSGLCSFTLSDLIMPLYIRDVPYYFDFEYSDFGVSICYPIVVQGEFDTATLNANTWRPFYDKVVIKGTTIPTIPTSQTIWDEFPMLNILPTPYYSPSGIYDDVEVVINDDGTISTYGTASTTEEKFTHIWLYRGEEPMVLPDVVSFSCEGLKNGASVVFLFSDGIKYFVFDKDEPLTINTNGATLVRCAIRLRNNDEKDDTMTLKPMLNAGEIAYPYQSNIDGLLEQFYNKGYEIGKTEGYDNGYTVGNTDGYSVGKTEGVNVGKEQGYNDGYTVGKTEGITEGKAEGFNTGYKAGEQSTVTRDFKSLLGDIVSAPYRAVSQMFDFEIFGINVAGAIFTLFTIVCIGIVISFFVKLII